MTTLHLTLTPAELLPGDTIRDAKGRDAVVFSVTMPKAPAVVAELSTSDGPWWVGIAAELTVEREPGSTLCT